ncbi:hypothetical protein [Nitrospina gracilis]|uniref:hypothetical protein n=1 Tax=Nitrospina gracilis TaxID=35801 RepID=UPI001F41BFA9|nr:hypothetical protein [Nitrospina gracilis]MCF8720979.1 hypothetical protein [Nitrospina gracilis Nb-211]
MDERTSNQNVFRSLGVDFSSHDALIESLPFSMGDTTAGSESELQAAVEGSATQVDLAVVIRESSFFSSVLKRCRAGEIPKKQVADLEKFLDGDNRRVWENSWVRFPLKALAPSTQRLFEEDLRANKQAPASPLRADTDRFLIQEEGGSWMRVPISYLLKLALADYLNRSPSLPAICRKEGPRFLNHFLNDNTSPETHSFYISSLDSDSGMGRAVGRETGQRYLLTQCLIQYANLQFQLKDHGQEAVVYYSPHPPLRQKKLNELIPDSFYRELFMSPCLSGWDDGEKKHAYMALCHEVLSRSQLNTLTKLKEAGIITRNLVCLPNPSNTSLANNGTHISLGSRKLTAALADPACGMTEADEKRIGDLVIKITEHFLPLFVETYSAAPYRVDFTGFHPEKALGFLPHELHYTHLRMFWRRWKKKARLKFFNHPVTPFGPEWLDSLARTTLGLKGDFIADFRLIDYLVCLLSTEQCPGLDGTLGNQNRLAKDLMHMGVFHEQMPIYSFFRLRQFFKMGYSGFEGRYYSLFHSLQDDLPHAVDLQHLITLFAYRLIASGSINHRTIPDDPFCESERRQIVFASAIHLPTFFVKNSGGNFFLRHILKYTENIRISSRYPGSFRVHTEEYKKALVRLLRMEAADLVSLLGMDETLRDLEDRVQNPAKNSAGGKLTRSILETCGAKSPFDLDAETFNTAAESHFRDGLRKHHIQESVEDLAERFCHSRKFHEFARRHDPGFLARIHGTRTREVYWNGLPEKLTQGMLSFKEVENLLQALLLSILFDAENQHVTTQETENTGLTPASVY